jgi:phage terminase small subunit
MKDLNGTKAAIRAGYAERTARITASQLLAKPNIRLRVNDLKAKRADELELDAYWVLKRLKDISDRSMQAVPVMVFDRAEGEMVETGEYEYDSMGANKATELIGKHIGMFEPNRHLKDKLLEHQIAKIAAETKNEETGKPRVIIVNDKEAMKKALADGKV